MPLETTNYSPPPTTTPLSTDPARSRVTQVFRYLQALDQLRNPAKRQVREQQWPLSLLDLPRHSSVQCPLRDLLLGFSVPIEADGPQTEFAPAGEDVDTRGLIEGTASETSILSVVRPTLTSAPPVPTSLLDWVQTMDDPFHSPHQIKERLLTITISAESLAASHNGFASSPYTSQAKPVPQPVRFDADPERVSVWSTWKAEWDVWAESERPARQTMHLYEQLYSLHSQLAREGERLDLVLGDGVLNWQRPEGGVHHPLLLQRLELHFDSGQNKFSLQEADFPVEFYGALFRGMTDIHGQVIRSLRDEAAGDGIGPLGMRATDDYLAKLAPRLDAHGEFTGNDRILGVKPYPRVAREPWIFVRQRTLGFTTALESILAALEEGAEIPNSLLNVVGIETQRETSSSANIASSALVDANEDQSVLLSKPANAEQLAIARRLDEHGNVLVQGPPGTGKTHTISNLVGHLLAQGKTVLVTSHTTKALRVLREQVVAPLRPLCVSVLDNDTESRQHLQTAVNAIVERISTSTVEDLEREGLQLAKERARLLADLMETRTCLLEARGGEFRDIVIQGETVAPSRAAREVAAGREAHSWLPGPLLAESSCPLTADEFVTLYATNDLLPLAEEMELGQQIPNAAQLLPVAGFRQFVATEQSLKDVDLTSGQALWQPVANQTTASLTSLRERCQVAVESLRDGAAWKLAAIAAGQSGGAERDVWKNLINAIESVRHLALQSREGFLAHGPELTTDLTAEEQETLFAEIVEHVRGGGNLGGLTLLLHRAWKPVLEKSRAGGGKPSRLEHFESLQALAKLTLERSQLMARWDRQMTPLGAPASRDLGPEPEAGAGQFIPSIRECLDWRQNTWAPLEAELQAQGLNWSQLLSQTPPALVANAELVRLRDTVLNALPAVLAAQTNRLQWRQVQTVGTEMDRRLAAMCSGENVAAVALRLQDAFISRNPEEYAAALARLDELGKLNNVQQQRQDLLAKLSEAAPSWASVIRSRQAPHHTGSPPGEITQAWRWRHLHEELERRDAAAVEALEAKVEELGQAIRANTAQLIDRRAWAAQSRRTTVPQRQALVGWVQTVRRIGRGTGKRVPQLQAEARRLMNQCRSAVPVWVMPLARVVENFDPRQTRFDVVIIDEASQSDVMGLIAFFLGRQVIVVGDDEQVSPDAVGQKADEVQHLIDEHLVGIPNANLYDGKFSVYDVAMSSFGGTICLREHFRCVPDIIRFSNYLSYNGAIKPLRDTSSVRLRPAVIPYRVRGAEKINEINESEAQAVVSLLVAACEQPEYEDATFGVISMIGVHQAERIDFLLRSRLEPAEYERRRIVCGNAAHFQGDEREVMFISMVNAPREGGPLMIQTQSAYQKRLNVAASRAREQMWVVHSLQPEIDLKAGDLRRRFLEHANDPEALQRAFETAEAHVESEFERQVLQRLVAAGYRVVPQWQVGSFRIDLVVEGVGKRLAVECDGDRYHGLDKLPEDMTRQALLERLGWKFARIRGSVFFRDPNAAMVPVLERLESLGIEKLGPAVESEAQRVGQHSVVVERIIERATILRQEWQHDNQDEPSEEAYTEELNGYDLRPGESLLA